MEAEVKQSERGDGEGGGEGSRGWSLGSDSAGVRGARGSCAPDPEH